jgi:hypothetical protein
VKHPLADLAATLRKTILAADPNIGEDRKDCIRLVFWHGDRANDSSGFLEGEYPDGMRLAILTSAEQLHQRKKALVAALKAQLRHVA